MPYTFLSGGARSGKSTLAVRAASTSEREVTFVATAEALDPEMQTRVDDHRLGRPAAWTTIEAPVAILDALLSVPDGDFVVLDCLTLWVANMAARTDHEILRASEAAARALAGRSGDGVVVSNEVGAGIVPAEPATRRYRDLLGRVNATFAGFADTSYLVVAGRTVRLEPPPW